MLIKPSEIHPFAPLIAFVKKRAIINKPTIAKNPTINSFELTHHFVLKWASKNIKIIPITTYAACLIIYDAEFNPTYDKLIELAE